ncbi:hypothetical protein FQA39_LY19102 [Lamprigera yunnana]|nr:hypothetical protein FQA39_LY19102 [Lamprigera yunnana]
MDTAGQERFRSMAPLFYRSANVAVLVFDITNIDSFHNVKDWVAELKGQIEEPIVICVVGNKSDLKSQRCISLEDANRYANRIGANYFECSAFYDQSIQEVFKRIAYELIKVTGKCDFLNTDSLSTCNGLSVNSSIEFYNVESETQRANQLTLNIAESKSSPPTESSVFQ